MPDSHNYLRDYESVSVYPDDSLDPMWQFQLRADGAVAVGGRDGTNWIHMPRSTWTRVVAAMSLDHLPPAVIPGQEALL